jgi:hypothetical protein
MADTIIAPAARESDSNAAGWAVAVILLLGIILFGIFVWPGMPSRNVAPSTQTDSRPNIDLNVTVPEGALPGTQTGGNTNQNQGSGNPATPQTQ